MPTIEELKAQYEADAEWHPRPWELWQYYSGTGKWLPLSRNIEGFEWERARCVFRRSPSAPTREAWEAEAEQVKAYTQIFSKCSTCRHEYDPKPRTIQEPYADLTPNALQYLQEQIQNDPEMAWSWHCNIAVAAMDEGLTHAAANRAAARFMVNRFAIDTTFNKHFAATQLRTIHLPEADLPEPMREAPENGDIVWVTTSTFRQVSGLEWREMNAIYHDWLEAGICHATHEAAQQWLDYWNANVAKR